jgi:hypothetical protein
MTWGAVVTTREAGQTGTEAEVVEVAGGGAVVAAVPLDLRSGSMDDLRGIC